MSLTFADLRKQNLLRAALNTDRLAEEVTFIPKVGPERTITVTVNSPKANEAERNNELLNMEEIDVRVAIDEDSTIDGRIIGGIREPHLGDSLLRAGEPAHRAWGFANTLGQTAESWLLRFVRQRRDQVGLTQLQR
jgi:hypothetical protein